MKHTIPIQVQRLSHAEGLPLPKYETEGAAGMDLLAAVDEPLHLLPGARVLVPTGLMIAVPVGYEAQVRPRSGLAIRNGITCPNAPGTIDSDYRGEVKVILANISNVAFTIERGMRIAQIVFSPVVQGVWETVDELPNTDRGAGGFGSTGK